MPVRPQPERGGGAKKGEKTMEELIQLTKEEYEVLKRKEELLQKAGYTTFPANVAFYFKGAYVEFNCPVLVSLDAMKMPEFMGIDIKNLQDLTQLVECRLVEGEEVYIKGQTLYIGADVVEQGDAIRASLRTLKEAGMIKDFYKILPKWLRPERVNVEKIGWWVAIVEKKA